MKNGLIIDDDGTKRWWLDDKLHRLDGPAVVHSNGTIAWCANGACHRLDGPAIVRINGDKEWYKNGMLHRTDGPALVYRTYKEYHLYDTCYKKDIYDYLVSNLPLLYWNQFKNFGWV